MIPSRILIIDNATEQSLGHMVKEILKNEPAVSSELVRKYPEFSAFVENAVYDLVVPIISSVDKKAIERLCNYCGKSISTPILPIVERSSISNLSPDILTHFSDFLVTPIQDHEILIRIRRLFSIRSDCKCESKKEIHTSFELERLLGEAPAFVALKRKIEQVARTEGTVLLTGETGTGKEICARALHYLSRRASRPFLPVNCAAIPIELFERELFGSQKGAFTNATASQGLIEEAQEGTLLLDEIESIALVAQAKLLRFLQDQTYYVLGSSRMRQANVWIIASTNVDLSSKVRDGSFREDLFYRLSVMTFNLPPMRMRRMDIPLLTNHFLELYSSIGDSTKHVTSKAMEALVRYDWPGNVRELENVIRQMIAVNETQMLDVDALPPHISALVSQQSIESFKQMKARTIEEFEKTYISELLDICNGNITHAAKTAQKERRAFGRLIKKYNLASRQHH